MSKDILSLQPQHLWKHFHEMNQIPRPSGHMKKVSDFVFNFGRALGLDTKKDDAGNILITKAATKGMENVPTVILQSHLDMVPQKNADVKHNFLTDPIETYIDGDKVRARSTTLGADNGIGVAAIMSVLEDKSLVHGKIEALFTIDEETGMYGAVGLKPGFLTGSILLNLDTEDEGELCVGCAGGADVNADFVYTHEPLRKGDLAFSVSLTGLRGGHSGCDIHLGRANANKLMFRFLKKATNRCSARLASIDGGSLRNAIPREAFAIITVPADKVDLLKKLTDEYVKTIKQEYKEVEHNIKFRVERTGQPDSLISHQTQKNLIDAVVGCQNGVISMLTDFEGIVETSTNLASIKAEKNVIEVKMLTRSSSETRKDELCSALQSVFSLAGAKVTIENSYPGWQPNSHSKIMDVMGSLFKDMFGRPADIRVVHAGLECGLILSSTPGLDIVSFGPTIVNPHSPDEYVVIDTVERFYNYLVKALSMIK